MHRQETYVERSYFFRKFNRTINISTFDTAYQLEIDFTLLLGQLIGFLTLLVFEALFDVYFLPIMSSLKQIDISFYRGQSNQNLPKDQKEVGNRSPRHPGAA